VTSDVAGDLVSELAARFGGGGCFEAGFFGDRLVAIRDAPVVRAPRELPRFFGRDGMRRFYHGHQQGDNVTRASFSFWDMASRGWS
jgi:hypothetical protein